MCSWYNFAQAIFEMANIEVKVNAIESAQYPTPTKRTFYSILQKSLIKEKFIVDVPPWKDSLFNIL